MPRIRKNTRSVIMTPETASRDLSALTELEPAMPACACRLYLLCTPGLMRMFLIMSSRPASMVHMLLAWFKVAQVLLLTPNQLRSTPNQYKHTQPVQRPHLSWVDESSCARLWHLPAAVTPDSFPTLAPIGSSKPAAAGSSDEGQAALVPHVYRPGGLLHSAHFESDSMCTHLQNRTGMGQFHVHIDCRSFAFSECWNRWHYGLSHVMMCL
jgi:hypothetical protein